MIHILAIVMAVWCTAGFFNMWRRNQRNARQEVPVSVLRFRGVIQLSGQDAARWWRENSIKAFLCMLFMAAVCAWLVMPLVRG